LGFLNDLWAKGSNQNNKKLRAGRNPPSVLNDIPLCSLPELKVQVQVLFGFALRGTDFSFRFAGNLRFCHHRAPVRIFSVLLPAISGFASPQHAPALREEFPLLLAVIVHQLAPEFGAI